MLLGLWQDRSYGGGNHWAYFGTSLDGLIQSLGMLGLFILSLPPAIIAAVAFMKSQMLWGIALVLA